MLSNNIHLSPNSKKRIDQVSIERDKNGMLSSINADPQIN